MNNDPNYDPFNQQQQNPQAREDDSSSLTGNYSDLKPIDEEGSSRRVLGLILLMAGFAGFCILIILGLAFFQPSAPPIIAQFFPSPTATPTWTITSTPTVTPTPTNTPTPTPNMTETQQAIIITSTAQAFGVTATYAADEWRQVFSESFDVKNSRWYTGSDDDEYAMITYEIKDGKYLWNAASHKGFITRWDVRSSLLGNFYLSVEARQPGFTTAADYGIALRESADGFYYFGINNKSEYFLYLNYQENWTTLIDPTQSPAILPREVNKLTVIAEGNHFVFFINDQFAAEIFDDTIPKGKPGIAIEIQDPDLEVTFEFDNIVLKTP